MGSWFSKKKGPDVGPSQEEKEAERKKLVEEEEKRKRAALFAEQQKLGLSGEDKTASRGTLFGN